MDLKYNVLIIGAGNIGAFFDTPANDKILTHAHAFTKHKGFNLIGFLDKDTQKAQKAAELWRCKAFRSLDSAFEYCTIDIACIAVPDDYHYIILNTLSKFPLQIAFTEKPLAQTNKEAKELIQIFKQNNIEIVVNYSRRFVPEFEKIKNDITKGIYGEYITGTGYYGKGIIHNGSHLIDVLRYFIGEIDSVKPVDSISDYNMDDKSIAAVLTFENNKPFFIQCVDCRNYTIFEIDLFFERKRVRIHDLGFKIEVYEIQKSKVYENYNNIIKVNKIDTSLQLALYYAAENIYNHLAFGQSFKSNIGEAYKTLKTCIKIIESIK
tara:strand:+ start:5510 stop:6475 length:966 start_codon:yes stop_codon:yes gene_type:complete